MGIGAGLYIIYMYDVVVEKFTFAISSPDEFLLSHLFNHNSKFLHHCLPNKVVYLSTALCQAWYDL